MKQLDSPNSWQWSDIKINQPEKRVKVVEPETLATPKDFKIAYEKIRLNTWCENIKFQIVTPNRYLDFDDLRLKFVTKSK